MTPKALLAHHPDLLTESQWASVVNDTARIGGWRRYHTYLSQRSPAGFPDLVLLRPPRLLFAELKTDAKTSRLTGKQEEWLEELRDLATAIDDAMAIAEAYLNERDGFGRGLGPNRPSVEVYVWRPSDWPEVVEILTGREPKEVQAA